MVAQRSQRVVGLIALSAVLALMTGGCAWTSLVSVYQSTPVFLDCCTSETPSISADGRYVAFTSNVYTIVDGDTNETEDVFVRDTVTRTTRRVSIDGDGNQANGPSTQPSISSDGRYVAFTSAASNLIDNDTNQVPDIFVRDTVAGTTSRVTLDSAGNQTFGGNKPKISGDGRYVAFESEADDLVADDTNFARDIFIRDRLAGSTSRVSVSDAGGQADRISFDPSISANGRYVAFASFATNLVDPDNNPSYDVYVRDTVAGTTELADIGNTGVQSNSRTTFPVISADGRHVAFLSTADNLVAGDTNNRTDFFMRDLVAETTVLISVSSSGEQAHDGLDVEPTISGDGRYVAFRSSASVFDGPGGWGIFVRDTVGGTTKRVNVDRAGEGDFNSFEPALSADGRYVAFTANGRLTPDETIGLDVYVRANPDPAISAVAPATFVRSTPTHITITGSSFIAGARVIIDGGGVTVDNVTVVSPTKITADATAAPGAELTARRVFVALPGTGEGMIAGGLAVCGGCITVN